MFARARAVVGAVALLAVSAPVARADPVAPADFVVLQDVDPSIEADIRQPYPDTYFDFPIDRSSLG